MKKGGVSRLVLPVLAAIVLCAGISTGASAAPTLIVDNNVNSPGYGYYIPDYFTTPNWANSPPLAKFVDPLPGLYISGVSAPPAAGTQYIPVAVPDTTTYPGSDYYEIEVGQYTQQMHSALPNQTTLRGYRQTNTTDPVVSQFHYLGPVIIAQKDRPVRIKFTNSLPTGAGGDLFLPVDTTIMGSGPFSIDYDPVTKATIPLVSGMFTQNRATLHLHGGRNPWISDGTAHQWFTPAGETTPYPKGVSAKNVPDMPDPGPGSQTFYLTNAQSARFMFYHDHSYGITRLNVYVGEAAGYVINDVAEENTLAAAGVPGTLGTTPDLAHLIPLVIQDKTFVDSSTVMTTDPTWAWGSNPGKPVTLQPVTGDLWWPHVYMPAQNPYNPDLTGMNAYGRWHYGPWFFPPTPTCGSSPDAVKPYCIENGPVPNPYYGAQNPGQAPFIPSTPNPSWGAEAFLDTMMVNGATYPTVTVSPAAYRFRILNAAHDRFLNLQLYKATPIVSGVTLLSGGAGYTSTPSVSFVGGGGTGATATASVDLVAGSPTFGQVTAINLDTVGSGYTSPPSVVITGGGATANAAATASIFTAPTEVGMVPAALTAGFPANWPADGREGGVPDPAKRGPAFLQIGSEGGLLPAPVVLPNQPVAWNLDPTMFNVGNVLNQADGGGTLFLAPAERADAIIDFSNYAGQTLILYNDAPTAFPALVPQYDYYTGAPDRRDVGGYGPIPPGVGPNIRTVMQIVVSGTGGTAPPDDYNPTLLSALDNAFRSTAAGPGLFARSQDNIVVGQSAYDTAYNTTFPATWPNWGISLITDDAISFQQVDNTLMSNFRMERKAIHDEMGATFDDYGRMSAKLGLEIPFANAATQTFVLQNFVDPPTERVRANQIQVWRITHNGVDTHPIHFHLFDVQLLNRVGWDGFLRLPDANELGWKDTVRISPLEDTIVALRPVQPPVPFAQPNSVRPLNPTRPMGDMMDFSQLDITDGGNLVPLMTNRMYNFGHEYTWHCHILSHEENDMMRAIVLAPPLRHQGVLFDNDALADVGIWRPSTGEWWIRRSLDNATAYFGWGSQGDIVVTGDYDGDGKTDTAVWRPSTGQWLVQRSSDSAVVTFAWGSPTDVTVQGDYDGDGKTDFAVWRPSTGEWFVRQSSDNAVASFAWGSSTDLPVPGDYDGDGRADFAVWRSSTGEWLVRKSSDTTTSSFAWGSPADVVVPGDYDGDGITDYAVWQPSSGLWTIHQSSDGATATKYWGSPGDIAVQGDYDGDGKSDVAIWRPSTGQWWISRSVDGGVGYAAWGSPTDVPLTGKY